LSCEEYNAKKLGTLEMAKVVYVIQYPVVKSGQAPGLSGEAGQASYRIGAPWSNIVPIVHKCLPLSAVTPNKLIYKSVFEKVVHILSSFKEILKYKAYFMFISPLCYYHYYVHSLTLAGSLGASYDSR